MNIAIIGCGASALYFAATNKKDSITIFERNKKIASKLLASGNGKCNLLNINATPNDYNNKRFIEKLFSSVSPKYIYDSFQNMGLLIKTDEEGRCYPVSESSQTVLNILLKNINAKIILEHTVKKISKIGDKYKIDSYDKLFDKVIFASGSCANIINDKSSLCYGYLEDIKLTKLKPSLTGFITGRYEKISGVRSKALVKLLDGDKLIHSESGEIIFKNDGISGIVVMNMSSYYNRYILKDPMLEIDLLEGYNPKDLEGALNPKLYDYIKSNNINPHKMILKIKDTYSYETAQVISGGVDLEEINDDFSYKKDKNIFFMGELLDIDGICGGYNLLFAFASAEKVRRCI